MSGELRAAARNSLVRYGGDHLDRLAAGLKSNDHKRF
jgi:hypothetical protein